MDTNKEEILDKKLSDLEEQRKEDEVKKQATTTGWPYINLKSFPISQDAIKVIKAEQAKALQAVCFLYTNEELRLASTNPDNPQIGQLKKELEDKYHAHLKIYLTSQASLNIALAIYDKIPIIEQIEGVNISAENLNSFNENLSDLKTLQTLLNQTNVTEMISLIIAAALKFNASDIHIETEEQAVKVRLRIDGVLQQAATIPAENWHKISSRIKLLAELKLNVTNQPQDGRFTINLSNDKIDVRVSTIPSTYGESIVMRLLRASSVGLQFEALGLRGKAFNDLANEVTKPNGMIITTGPTGSGKTTTLYAILNKLNQADTKIITLEDPIEYKLPGIVQSQVENSDGDFDNSSANPGGIERKNKYTFAKGLRAILRQDPDIVMVGEIRDLETADTAINAALTGHLMLSKIMPRLQARN
ncbi:MAG: type II secretion system protein E [Parcubacteria group bacterium GW2011_GWA2_36_10]|nr:MAG: type II secretion system protein E [Parcubacteria group bacterium GW2011_GWA2_36_10]